MRIAGVYFPPYSLSDRSVLAELSKVGPVDLLLGDFNAHFPTQNRSQDLPLRYSIRSQCIQSWAVENRMQHLSDTASRTSISNIPDHAFCSQSILPNVQLSLLPTHKFQFHTDHKYFLLVTCQPVTQGQQKDSGNSEHPPSETLVRYQIQRLSQPAIASRYQQSWTVLQQFSHSYSGSERFNVDMLDALLLCKLESISHQVLGSYQPCQMKKKGDVVASQLSERVDSAATIQLMKRALRASSSNSPIISTGHSSTPMEECVTHYKKLFCIPDGEIDGRSGIYGGRDPYHTPSSWSNTSLSSSPRDIKVEEEELIASGLSDKITEERIKAQILKIDTTTSPGRDGIHVLMLRHLLDTSLLAELRTLYHTCLLSGKTPTRWNDSLVFPIQKDKARPYSATNSRPI
ncbi:hypothetical protein HOY82DRAFT_620037, partial [Tuber indicum]